MNTGDRENHVSSRWLKPGLSVSVLPCGSAGPPLKHTFYPNSRMVKEFTSLRRTLFGLLGWVSKDFKFKSISATQTVTSRWGPGTVPQSRGLFPPVEQVLWKCTCHHRTRTQEARPTRACGKEDRTKAGLPGLQRKLSSWACLSLCPTPILTKGRRFFFSLNS